MDLHYPASKECPEDMFLLNTDSYLYDLLRAREKFGNRLILNSALNWDSSQITSKKFPTTQDPMILTLSSTSTHVVQHQDPAFPSYYEGISTEEGYRAYFNEILTSIRSFTNFDIYGHIDYVIRYSKTKDLNYCYGQYADIFDPIIETLIANGKGIEINTAGLDKGLKEQHPCTEFIRQYRKKGGEIITVDSDAHRPEDIGRHFDHAADVLKECGFSYYCTFEKRHRLSISCKAALCVFVRACIS